LVTPSSPGSLPTLSLTTNSSWLPWGRVAMPLISPLMPVPQLWLVSVTQMKKLEATHHRWQRSTLGISRKDKVLPKLEDIIRCRRLRWLGHFSRMDHHRLPWQALTSEPEGFRRRTTELERCRQERWASAGTRLKRLRRTGGAGGIVSSNASLTQDEPGARNLEILTCCFAQM